MKLFITSLLFFLGLTSCNQTNTESKTKNDMQTNETIQNFQSVDPKSINENTIELIGNKWMLVTAGDSSSFNTMTASWGAMGYLWNKPVVFVFIRPQRYTFGFIEQQEEFTLSFFKEEYRQVLQICGSTSGRDVNKVEKAGITPYFTSNGNITFEEAYLVLECKKLYADFLKPDAFIDSSLLTKNYPEADYHKVYIAEIINVLEKK